ncbi:MAG: hypothetical protein CVT64_01075 [Actinobacteria bacterium HGW-Actinobacteria-4]|nr:MAG: hypothetical protein CVT64_01075 [Actinobacteria bacterium HGW-Actinobacteria-4]
MSDAPVPNDALPNDETFSKAADVRGAPKPPRPVPDIDELERDAILATFRRAPRLGRVIGTGVSFGAGLGLALGFLLPNSTGVYRGTVAVLLGLGFALIGGLTAGAIATRMDRASVDDRDGRPSSSPTDEHDA